MTKLFLIFYNCLLLVFLCPILLAIVLSGKRNRQDFFYCIKERLSMWNLPVLEKSKKTVWIHCASLGEAKAVEPMIQYLKNYNVVVSAITKSAREYISNIGGIAFFALAPVDLYPFISKTLKKVKPDALILIETEFWPSMIYCAHNAGAKIITVNGRISKNAFTYYKLTKLFWKTFLNLIDYISVRNEQDYERYAEIIGSKNKIGITGNIKYDRDFTKESVTRESLFYGRTDLILTAGSTRKNEENFILESFKRLKEKFKNLKLILAPRHISRVREICGLAVKNGFEFSLLSRLDGKVKDVLIIDSFGKLQSIYSISDIVFIGGSAVNTGGQNPIEPAAYSKPVIFGRYMYNFESESKLLKELKGAFEIKNKEEFIETADKLLSDPVLRNDAGKKAAEAVDLQKGAIKTNIELIEKYLK